jgi:hypothetical protein
MSYLGSGKMDASRQESLTPEDEAELYQWASRMAGARMTQGYHVLLLFKELDRLRALEKKWQEWACHPDNWQMSPVGQKATHSGVLQKEVIAGEKGPGLPECMVDDA